MSIRNYISKDKIETIAIDKYRKNGLGITIEDIKKEFLINKRKAQRTLKYLHEGDVIFTASDLISEGINILQNKNPQQYFPSCIKAEIIEDLGKRKNVLVDPTGVDLQIPSSKCIRPISNDIDTVTQTLEGYVLPLLPQAPIFIHNLHFKIRIDPECYLDLDLPYYDKNNGKRHSENIGTSHADYILYPNGTVDIHVRCSNNPYRLETEVDLSTINAFFGQIRDRLIILLRDEHERIVPEIMDWQMTECDINKDIKISHLLHFSAIKVQVKCLDHLFRIYIKSKGENTLCRVEESRHPHKPAMEVINDVFNPLERIEREIIKIHNIIHRLPCLLQQRNCTDNNVENP